MLLHKTELAHATLARNGTELGRRERQVLILCDGRRSLDAIVSMLGVDSLGMIQPLIASGYLAQDKATTATPAPPPAALPAVAVTAASPRAMQSRRSMAACKMYMIDMLQLQRTPEAASLSVALQTAQDDDERALALVDALTWLRTATKASVCERVAERLKEIVPEAYLAGIEAAWQQMIVDDLSVADGSNVVRFEMRA
ncbi:MAG: hypothetical protein JF567_08805 [Xanthomonadales bacterium]|nr:hypothetical protein [Xanthomonadales bacterium]